MSQLPSQFRCLVVRRDASGQVSRRVESLPTSDLPPGEVTIRVAYSSLNYKDALAAGGHPGVARKLPHVPGIDAAGTVVTSFAAHAPVGAKVLVTGYELGASHWGGWAELIRVPAQWVVPLPEGLSLRESMMLGTAGFTAALGALLIEHNRADLPAGPLIVSGATGGVGSLAVAILARLGHAVTAVTGKPGAHELLKRLGAQEIVGRESVVDDFDRPLLTARWAGGVDTVGGAMLGSIIRATLPGGCVTACGLVGGTDLPITVYPFILRGVMLLGINSSGCQQPRRSAIWQKLAGPWKPPLLDELTHEVPLDALEPTIADILASKVVGRTLVRVGGG